MPTTPRLWKNGGQVNTTDQAQAGSNGTNSQYAGEIVALNDGGYVIAWNDNSYHYGGGPAVVAQRYDAGGNKVGGEVVIAARHNDNGFIEDPSISDDSAIALLPNGNIVITYTYWTDLFL